MSLESRLQFALGQLAGAVAGQGPGAPASLPAGLIVMWSGLVSAIPSGWVICDGNNGTPNLLAKFIKGVATAATNPGANGGAATHTHANHVVTQPNAHVVTQPSAHSNHVVTQPAGHSNHVVTQPADHSGVITHTHGIQAQGSTTAATTGTHLMTSTATGGSSRAMVSPEQANAPAGAVSTLSHSATAVDAHSSHSGAAVDAHSAHAGTAVDAHAGTAVDAHSTVNSEPAYYALAFIMKT